MDLPLVDLAPYLDRAVAGGGAAGEEAVRALCATVSASLRDTGALLVKDPRCPAADNDRFLDVVEHYFARSADSKCLQERPNLHYQVGVTPEGVEVPRSLVDKEMQDKIKSMPEEFQPATPKGPDPKWRYMWRVGPRPANTRFKELNSEPVIPDGLPEWKETMDSWGSKMISAIEVDHALHLISVFCCCIIYKRPCHFIGCC
jgi:isopenicillin N synthase-like dioxygenase